MVLSEGPLLRVNPGVIIAVWWPYARRAWILKKGELTLWVSQANPGTRLASVSPTTSIEVKKSAEVSRSSTTSALLRLLLQLHEWCDHSHRSECECDSQRIILHISISRHNPTVQCVSNTCCMFLLLNLKSDNSPFQHSWSTCRDYRPAQLSRPRPSNRACKEYSRPGNTGAYSAHCPWRVDRSHNVANTYFSDVPDQLEGLERLDPQAAPDPQAEIWEVLNGTCPKGTLEFY